MAGETFDGELRRLRDAAGLTHRQMIRRGKEQLPPVEFTEQTLSDWFRGNVKFPHDPGAQDLLIKLLEREAKRRDPTHPSRSIEWWRALREAQRVRPAMPERPIAIGLIPPLAVCLQTRPAIMQALVGSPVAGEAAGLPTAVVSGLGGVGKTQMVAAYAHGVLETSGADGVDLLLWVPAGTRSGIAAAYARAAESVGLAKGDDMEATGERFLEWLESTDKRWLIILDDLAEAADLRGLWPPERRPNGQVVVTTRRRDASLLAGRRLVDVEEFTPSEAASYLSERLPGALADDVDGVAVDLGYLPLALSHAAIYMVDGDVACSGYRTLFAGRRRRLADLFPHPDTLFDNAKDKGNAATVATTWSLSIERADQLPPAGLAAPLFELASMLDPGGIPRDLFTTLPALRFSIGGVAVRDLSTADPGGDRLRDGLANLRRFNLITTIDSTIRVHSLVQRAARESLPAARAGAVIRAAADALLACWPKIEREPTEAAVLRANAAVLASRAEADALWSSGLGGHPVLDHAVKSLSRAGLLSAAITAATELHQQANQRLGPDDPYSLAARANAAVARGEAGDALGAVVELERVLANQLRVLGPNHIDIVITLAHLASWRGEAGDVAGAVAEYEHLLDFYLKAFGPEHPDTLTVRSHLARWRLRASRGDGAEFGDVVGDEVGAEFGDVVGDEDGMVAEHERLLDDHLRVLGPDHPSTLHLRSILDSLRVQAGDVTAAIAEQERLVDDHLRVHGPHHPDTLTTRGLLAMWRGMAGDAAAAVAELEQVLEDMLRVFGPDHPHTSTTRTTLAMFRLHGGDAAGAIAELERLLAHQLRLLGPDHPDTFSTRSYLAMSRAESGDAAAAVADLERLLNDAENVLGPDHPDTFIFRSQLMLTEAPAAVTEHERLMAEYLRTLGPDHPDTLTNRALLIFWRSMVEMDAGKATAEYELLLADQLRVLGPDHPDTFATRSQLVSSRAKAGDLPAATGECERLLEDFLRVFGPDDPDTASIRSTLTTLRRLQENVFGPDDPDTASIRSTLAKLRRLEEDGS